MFGGPLGKLLVLIAVIAAVWYGYKYVERINELRGKQGRRAPKQSKRPALQAEDMAKCRVCGTYVAPDAGGCGRPDCPY
jgi:uncharacterized protein